MGTAASLALTISALTGLTGYAVTKMRGWRERGITAILPWRWMLPVQVTAGIGAAAYVQPVWGSAAATAAAAFVWLGVLAIGTDLKTYKVPWDVSHPVALLGLVLFALNYSFEGLLALVAALLGAVGVPLLARWITRKGLGMSDIRLLWAAVATTSWWVGQTWLLYALLAAAAIQLVIRVMAPFVGWGRRETDISAFFGASGAENTDAGRIELPFAPALVVSLVALVGYGTHVSYGACMMWNPLGPCSVA